MKPCPQCGSECGPTVCRFSGITHKFAEELRKENAYAAAMIRRDKETPRWMRELRTGARDIRNGE